MNRFEHEHTDGIGDGLSMALGILQKSRNLEEAQEAVIRTLRLAREAKDRSNLRALTEMVSDRAPAPAL